MSGGVAALVGLDIYGQEEVGKSKCEPVKREIGVCEPSVPAGASYGRDGRSGVMEEAADLFCCAGYGGELGGEGHVSFWCLSR